MLDGLSDDQCLLRTEGSAFFTGASNAGTGQKYQTDILETAVIPHFDDHPFLTRPVFIGDNARPERSRAVIDYSRQNAISTLPWAARSPEA